MVKINLGRNKYGEDVIWDFPDNTSILIEGLQGSGKSYLSTLILSQLKMRNILILDYEGEHYHRLRKSPCLGDYPSWWLPTIYKCAKPYFPFNEMGRFDLMGLNMPEGGALVLAQLSKVKEASWKDIENMINYLPTSKATQKANPIQEYNDKYGTTFKDSINAMTKQSLVIKLPILKEIFENEGESYFIPELWKNYKYVSLDFSFKGMEEASISRARLFYGKFIDQFWDYLYQYSPVIFIEEAKIVAPDIAEGLATFRSFSKLNEFQLHQRRRTGSMLICVIQNEELISRTIKNTYAYKISHVFNDVHGRRWFTVGDNNYWKKGSGIHGHFYVHEMGYLPSF